MLLLCTPWNSRLGQSVALTGFQLPSSSCTVTEDPAFPPAVKVEAGAVPKASCAAVAFSFPFVEAWTATTPTLAPGLETASPLANWARTTSGSRTRSIWVFNGWSLNGLAPEEEMLIVPVMAPAVCGVTVIFRVQLVALASVVPQLSVSLNSPLAVITRLSMDCPVLLVSVAVCAADVPPLACTPKFSTGGESVSPAGLPSPCSETDCVPPPALSVMVSVPVRWPSAVGTNWTVSVHVAPTAIAEPQLSLSVKSPCVVNPPSCRTVLPVFEIVTLKDVPVAVKACAVETKGRLPNARLVGKMPTPVC